VKKVIVVLIILVARLPGPTYAGPTSYSGGLSAPDGLDAGGDDVAWSGSWPQPPTLTWTVTEVTPGTWHYRYTLTVPADSIGRMIIEASDSSPGPAFEQGDLQSRALSPWPGLGDISVGNHLPSPENPGMPEAMWGVQVDTAFFMSTLTLDFDSSRRPVWGDFYARTPGFYCPANGAFLTPQLNWLRNRGFTLGDVDPTVPAGNGSILNHLLVPDSATPPPADMTLSEKAAELAKQVIGRDYLLSQGDPSTKGLNGNRFVEASEIEHLDCSGLIFWAYNKASGVVNYQIESPSYNAVHYQSADGQFHCNCSSAPIQQSELIAGDFLFFDWQGDGHIDHVEMYVGEFSYGGGVIRDEQYPAGTYDIVAARGDETHNEGIVPDRAASRAQHEGFVGFRRLDNARVGATVAAHCPVDLVLTDPDGFTVNRNTWEVPRVLYYSVFDIDNDGDLDAMITIAERKPGNYSIAVVSHADASPTDAYGLVVTSGDQTLVLAENTLIRDTPHQPYLISSTESGLQIVTPQPVGDLVSVTMGRAALDAKTGQFSVNVTVKNKSSRAIGAPVWLVIDSVSSLWVMPVNTSGTTADGKPYFDLSGLLGDGKLDPGEAISQRVNFGNPGRLSFTFKSSVRGVILP